ncbi:piggyBac transposable element-derived protein 4-like [Mizuhopecten yessoensis]|uniref:piggyBac transposable element-derived protein 4-like n=1 Tax=Mizuhopecten yessoensis TaxID=6573 RepID=UPI000B45ECE7|nr:piggyBac transposable element-derived protein 4-like [Mizuhopecten yessoensis]
MLGNFSEVYTPGEFLSFDEGTCPFKGRVRFRVYNPMKPNKFGIKLYEVCEAKSGYMVGFHIYDGKSGCCDFSDAVDLDDDCTITTKTVVGLLARHGLLSKGYKVFLDNYYNSPELTRDTYICGTLRGNRKGIPKVFAQVKKMRQGEGIHRQKGNTTIVKFHDKRDILMITSFHEAKLYVTDKTDKAGAPILKPNCIVDYVKKMGGVDLSD